MEAKDPKWQEQFDGILGGLQEWRKQHPKATFAEIEQETLKRTAALQAQLMEDLSMSSGLADWEKTEAPKCPECGTKMHKRGKQKRQLQNQGGQEITLDRTYAVCPKCGAEIFPPG